MQSSAENDEQLMSLVEEALGLPADKRADFLRAACGDRTDLYTQAAEVLEWEERMGSFLIQPLIESIDLEVTEPPCSVFQSRDVICDGRFEILREIGQGGMAVVYEAIDRKLNWRIAIKCPKPGFGRLLPPEVRGALKVHHSNICRVNDTHTAKTDSGDVDFLTMEFLDGETLAARLARDGKLSPEETLTIARQLCAGLAAAHQAGIVHRDLKPSNIILTTNENGEARAVITDFGLATESRLESPIEGGTPRYMAPEIWEEHKSGKAADVYALGVILYEMVTGTESFQPSLRWDGTPTPPPEPPSIANKDLPALWDKAILPCLDRNPERRPKTGEILAVFDRKPLWKSPALYLAALILIALAAGFQRPLLRLLEGPDIKLAILQPESTSGARQIGDQLSQQLAEQLRLAQKRNGSIIVLPPSDLLGKGVHSPEQTQSLLHATHAVTLKLNSDGANLDVRANILELSHGTHLRHFSAHYSARTRQDMVPALSAAIAGALHLPNPAPYGSVSPEARPDYEKGLFLLDRDDQSFDEAMKYFETAAQRDPHSGLPLAGLAEAELLKCSTTTDRKWAELAAQHVKEAAALSPDSLPVLLAEGKVQANAGHPEQALESYQRAGELDPNNIAVLLETAEIYKVQNQPESALRLYRRAVASRPGLYKAYERLGLFFYVRGDLAAAAEQYQKAVNLAPERYDLHISLASALSDQGEYPAAEQEYGTALRIRKTGWALCGLGAVKESEHRDDQAVPLLLQSIALDSKSATCYLNLGDALRRLHRSGAAERAYLAALKLTSAEVRQNPREGFERAFIGYFAARLGQRSRAIDETEEALQLYPEDSKVLRRAILTYEALGQRDRALDLAAIAPASLLRELDRHPDLADFRLNSRFRQLVEQAGKRGK